MKKKRPTLTKIHLLFISLLITLFSACQKDPIPLTESERTVLVYIAPGDGGVSDLSSYLVMNANQMELGMKSTNVNGRMLCLYDITGEKTRLLEFTKTGRKVLIEYGEVLNTAKVEVFRQVLNDVKRLAPAKGYGVILSSHGSGWLPPPTSVLRSAQNETVPIYNPLESPLLRPIPQEGIVRAWGQHGRDWMTTDDLVSALPDNGFDFVMFDACYMASVELLYALRNKAPYFMVSPTEIMAEGFPYNKMISSFFEPKATLEKGLITACQTYFNHYDSKQGGQRSASIALIYTPALDYLAQKIKSLNIQLDSNVAFTAQKFNRQDIYPSFDFTDAYLQSRGVGGVNEWQTELDKVVLFTRHTTYFWDLKLDKFSGLSTYIPLTRAPITNDAYRQTAWYKATN